MAEFHIIGQISARKHHFNYCRSNPWPKKQIFVFKYKNFNQTRYFRYGNL